MLLEKATRESIFDAGRSGQLRLPQFRNMWHQDRLRGGMTAVGTRVLVPQDLLNELVSIFRDLLGKYIDKETDRIGDGLVNLVGGVPEPTISDYVQKLVRAAATLGGQRTLEVVFGWTAGEPIQYQTRALLTGVNIENSLILREGLKISQLPKSSNELAPHLPPMIMQMYGIHDFLARVVLSIECEAAPAFYIPCNNGTITNDMKHTWLRGKFANFSLDSFCESLSLSCGNNIRWQYSWRELGDIREFCSIYGGISFTNAPTLSGTASLTQEQFEQASTLSI